MIDAIITALMPPLIAALGVFLGVKRRTKRAAARESLRSVALEYWEKVNMSFPSKISFGGPAGFGAFKQIRAISMKWNDGSFYTNAVERISNEAKPLSMIEKAFVKKLCIDLVGEPLYIAYIAEITDKGALDSALNSFDNHGSMSRIIVTGSGVVSAPNAKSTRDAEECLTKLATMSPANARRELGRSTALERMAIHVRLQLREIGKKK